MSGGHIINVCPPSPTNYCQKKMMKINTILISILFLLLASCSKNGSVHNKYEKQQLQKKAGLAYRVDKKDDLTKEHNHFSNGVIKYGTIYY